MPILKKKHKKSIKSIKGNLSPQKQEALTIVTVRISDDEKERIDQIMNKWNIKRYSDVMRMAVMMLKTATV